MADNDIDLDLEEGECTDDSDSSIEEKSKIDNLRYRSASSSNFDNKMFAQDSLEGHQNTDKYECSRIPQIVINSDESDSDDDDRIFKRSRPSNGDESFKPNSNFVNPLIHPSININKKNKNNIWGSVLTEQVLSQEMKSVGVENSFTSAINSRDVESYDFRKAKEDDRPDVEIPLEANDPQNDDPFANEVVDLEKEVKRHEIRKRKRNVKDRLGFKDFKNRFDKSTGNTLGVTELNTEEEIVEAITFALAEPKAELFTKIVKAIGKELAIRIYFMTETIENAGGMMINSGFRRRTPGGVYIQLLKTQSNVSESVLEEIFAEDQQKHQEHQKQLRKKKRAARRRFAKERMRANKPEMDIDHQSEEASLLAESENLLEENELDTADFPERPATPEPKDDSSDGEINDEGDNHEDEEGEDIAIAIAKAKAAILKKQRELANSNVHESVAENTMDNTNEEVQVSNMEST